MKIEDYDLELEKLSELIKQKKARKVCIQLPDGLKPHGDKIIKKLEKLNKETEFFLYGGSNFGACDVPLHLEKLGIDLLVNFGHNNFGLNQYIKTKG